jgi:glucan phosphorylase
MKSDPLLNPIKALASNYRWAWTNSTQRLFQAVDAKGLARANGNPWTWLVRLGEERAEQAFAEHQEALANEYAELSAYLDAPSAEEPPVAYFSMEYGIHESLPIYSGGLGILAGDHLKEASDLGLDMVALGFLYSEGYLSQSVDSQGRQLSKASHWKRDEHPLCPLAEPICIHLPEGPLYASVYELAVGRTRLYLLDPDTSLNTNSDYRGLCARLYGGDHLTRLRQELLLGVGGMRLLRRLGYEQRVLHLNEGHCAFALVEAVRQLGSVEAVKSRSVFTTHTPVPAGHDRFGAREVSEHLGAVWEGSPQSTELAQSLGRESGAESGSICMTVLALNLSARCNGVSAIHGRVSRKMWPEWDIGHVTNGVHAPTWVAPEIQELKTPADLSGARQQCRTRLINFLKAYFEALDFGDPGALDPNALTLGFARRFAPYKRAALLLENKERLAALLTHPERPVQILYAGKAHPADAEGQALLTRIWEASKDPVFGGRIHFIPNYDMQLGRLLVQGCDVWLNTPRRPLEASGTSGQKAAMNGCLNLSVPDGWWPEGYNGQNGWVIGNDVGECADSEQDSADVESLFQLLEKQVVPLFYENGSRGNGPAWMARMQQSITTLSPRFSATRMLHDYITHYYRPAAGR